MPKIAPKMKKTEQLMAIETFLSWDMDTYEDTIEILDNIYWVVVEKKLRPDGIDGIESQRKEKKK